MGLEFVQRSMLGCWSRRLGFVLFQVLRLHWYIFVAYRVCHSVFFVASSKGPVQVDLTRGCRGGSARCSA